MTEIQFSRLENGMRVLTEKVDHVETVSLGVWLDRGSREETERENGMFHFIEHTLFKGTPSRNAREIAESVDGVGGILDAYTSKEETCYSIRVMDKYLDTTLEILADMLRHPLFHNEELDRERMVILEEIKMEEDNPEDLAYEKNMLHFWRNQSIGRPILGSPANVSRFDQGETSAFHRKYYRTENMLVSAAGKVDHEKLCAGLTGLFPGDQSGQEGRKDRAAPEVFPFQVYLPNSHLEQVNFCLSFQGVSLQNSRRHDFYLLNTILGAGMSSRLFQTIREERGLTYNIGSFTNCCSDCGQFLIYGGCSPEYFDEVVRLSLGEVRRLLEDGITPKELERAKAQFTSSLVMNLENTQARAAIMAKQMLYLEEVFDLDLAISRIEAVRREDIHQLARDLFSDETLGLSAVGPLALSSPADPWTLNT